MDVYEQAADWLEANPDRWIKGDYFRDSADQILGDISNYRAALDGDICFCLSGLLHALVNEEISSTLEERFRDDLLGIDTSYESLPAYNDAGDTELDDIIRRLRDAARRDSP